MHIGLRSVVAALIVAMALPVIIGADATPASARREIELQLGDLLLDDERYWEAIVAYSRAKEGAEGNQLLRASSGLVRSLLQVGEFTVAQQEGVRLRELAPRNPRTLVVSGDALWAAGLFDEAEQIYRDALALAPDVGQARHGLARSLATRSRLDEALAEAQAALKLSPREAAFHHTVGSIYRQLHRFEEAATAFETYIDLLPRGHDSTKAQWTRAEIEFLRSFRGRVPVEISPEDATQLHTVAFRLIRDKAVVRGRINGRRPIDFVLDTGAEHTMISQRVARRAGIQAVTNTLSAGVGEPGLRGIQVGRLDSLEIGPLKISNVPVLIKNPPISGLPTREAESLSPLALGLSMAVDYKQHHLIIGRNLPEEPADIELPLRMHRLAVVRGVVNGDHPKSFVVDTGGEVISISLATAAALGPRTVRRIPLRVYGTSGWDPDAFLLPGVDLAFDTIRYPNFSVVVLNLHRPSALLGFHIGGIIGHKFLSNYRVGIDLNRSVVRLKEL